MSRTINFVQERQRQLTGQEKKDRRYFKISAAVFAGVLVLYGVTFGVYLYLQYQLKQAQDRQLALEQQILSQGEVEKSAAILAEKVTVMSELLSQRSNKQEAIAYFSSVFGPQVLIKDMKYNGEGRALELNIETDSLFSLKEVFATLESPSVAQEYPETNKRQLRRSADAAYQLQLDIVLGDVPKDQS